MRPWAAQRCSCTSVQAGKTSDLRTAKRESRRPACVVFLLMPQKPKPQRLKPALRVLLAGLRVAQARENVRRCGVATAEGNRVRA